MSDHNYPNATLVRRLAAMVYDFFLIVAVWILTTIVVIAFVTDGEEATGIFFQMMLLAEMFLFYAYFWKVKGQTLGMQVWKIRAQTVEGDMLGWLDSFLRFGYATLTMALAGIGFIWMIFDKDRLTLYDRMSNTRVVYMGDKPFEKEKTGG